MKKKILVIIALMSMVAASVVMPQAVSAKCVCPEGSDNVGKIVDTCSASTCGSGYTQEPEMGSTLNNIINMIIGIVGLITVIMIIVGGIMYAISSGDSGKTKKAKDTIMYGIIGLVIAILAFAIVNFIIGNL